MIHSGTPDLDARELIKRKRERIAIALLGVLFVVLTIAEFKLSKVSTTLPFVNSIFFFGLLNLNIVLLVALVWLVFRNIGKLFIERRRKVLGSRLKTKLVISFLAFSIIPTLVLFTISALYINSSFDKWFSLKIQNTLQASLEITHTYYRNSDNTALHFADHLSKGIASRLSSRSNQDSQGWHIAPSWLSEYLNKQRELLALDAVEYYPDSFEERILSERSNLKEQSVYFPRLPLDLLDKVFSGEPVSVIQHIGTGDLIRRLVPVVKAGTQGVLVVNTYIPVSLVNKVDEIASVFDDYADTNPLKYPIKTAYFVILVMITLVIIFVAIWIGLHIARELTVPVERLVFGAQAVGAGNLDFKIDSGGQDEISVLINSFNKMTQDLRENRERLTQASSDLEKRRLQLEAVLTNVGTGVIVVDRSGEVMTFNRAVSQLLDVKIENILGKKYSDVLTGDSQPIVELVKRVLDLAQIKGTKQSDEPEVEQWNARIGDATRALAAVATPLRDSHHSSPWGVVVVIDDMTHLIKAQRETAWREVARRIAHEIKNPLTPIKLSAQRLQRRLSSFRGKDGALLKECTDTIISHADQMKDLVNEFSSFARFPEVNPTQGDLNRALMEVVALFQQAHPGIQFWFTPENRLPVFEFDQDQIKRVLINLLDNAVSALQMNPPTRVKWVKIETHFNDQLQMAVLTVKDNGPGMSDQVKERLFEPYFSTKAEGTGLGLAIVKRIINDHDGFIRVQSNLEEGTQFLIELPTVVRHGVQGIPGVKAERNYGTKSFDHR
ncbi:HAMP domain-containing protein [bacterium]|nr:HAMP domain-containing protein [bacterium]